MFTKDICN